MNVKTTAVSQTGSNTSGLYTPEPEINDSIVQHDSWAMSFVDLLMLLLTLFVLLLSFSNNSGSTKNSITALKIAPQILTVVHKNIPKADSSDTSTSETVFTKEPTPETVAIASTTPQVMPNVHQETPTIQQFISPLAPTPDNTPAPLPNGETAATLKQKDTRSTMINDIVEKLNQDYDQQDTTHKDVQISATTTQINLEISEAILFPPASDELTAKGAEVLQQLAGVLSGYPFRLSVEGHTDNTPITSARFPSNWELSTARATKVTRMLIDDGYPSASIRSIGYSDTQPLADNDTPEGRAKNRRVSIVMDLPAAGDDKTASN